MAEAESLGGAAVTYTGRALCAMYDLGYTEARGRALMAALTAGREEVALDAAATAAIASALTEEG